MNSPKEMPARHSRNKRVPMAVRRKLTFLYYSTGWRLNKYFVVSNKGGDRSPRLVTSAPAHLAAVGLHGCEVLLPGAGRRFQAVTVEEEFVDELVQGGVVIGDAPGVGDDEHLPVLQFFDVVYCLFEAGTVVEEDARCSEVLVGGDELVACRGGVGSDGGLLLVPGKELAVGIGPYVRGRSRHAASHDITRPV